MLFGFNVVDQLSTSYLSVLRRETWRSMLAANELFYDFHKFLSSILSSIPT